MVIFFGIYTIFLYVSFFVLLLRRRPPFMLLLLIKVFFVGLIFFLPDKLAVVEINEVRGAGFRHNFLFYYVLGFPLVEFVNMPRAAMAAVSTATSSIIAALIVNRLNLRSHQKRSICLSALLFFPDVMYFSAFSVRDVSIAFFSLYIVFLFYISLSRGFRPEWKHIIITSIFLLSLRPELILWLAATIGVFFLAKALSASMTVIWSFSALGISVLLFDIVAPSFLKFVGLINPEVKLSGIEAWRIVLGGRYYRQFSDSDGSGTTSALFDPFLFETASNFHILFIQITSFLTLGLSPMTITKFLGMLSGFSIFVFVLFRINSIYKSKAFAFVIISGFLSFLIFAPFAVNGGNVFRMRLPLMVILIFLSIVFSLWSRKGGGIVPLISIKKRGVSNETL